MVSRPSEGGYRPVCACDNIERTKPISLVYMMNLQVRRNGDEPVKRLVVARMYVECWDDGTQTWQTFQGDGRPSSRGSCSTTESNCKEGRRDDRVRRSRAQQATGLVKWPRFGNPTHSELNESRYDAGTSKLSVSGHSSNETRCSYYRQASTRQTTHITPSQTWTKELLVPQHPTRCKTCKEPFLDVQRTVLSTQAKLVDRRRSQRRGKSKMHYNSVVNDRHSSLSVQPQIKPTNSSVGLSRQSTVLYSSESG
jgi:hypothetical protein